MTHLPYRDEEITQTFNVETARARERRVLPQPYYEKESLPLFTFIDETQIQCNAYRPNAFFPQWIQSIVSKKGT